MAGSAFKRARFKILDDLGMEGIAELYLGECKTVKELCERIWEPHPDYENISTFHFYRWLKARGLKEEWQEIKKLKGSDYSEESLRRAMDADESNVRSEKLKVDTLKWLAERYNREELGQSVQVNQDVTVSFGVEWGRGMLEAEKSDVKVIEAVVSDEDGAGGPLQALESSTDTE